MDREKVLEIPENMFFLEAVVFGTKMSQTQQIHQFRQSWMRPTLDWLTTYLR